MRLLDRCDAIRQPERFARVLQACECDARGRLGMGEATYPQAERLLKAQQAALSVETAPIAQAAAAQGLKGPQIGVQITQARVRAILNMAP
jgi:tRNA nucleotidyltransferase (CCA-adding enzyme)